MEVTRGMANRGGSVGGKGRVGDAHVRESGAGLFLSDGDR